MTRMTDKYPPAATPPLGRSAPSESLPPASAREHGTAGLVKGEAADLGNGSVQAGKHVAEVAREQASGVVAEAGRQGRGLLQQAQQELEVQAAHGQQRLAKQLLSLSDELRSMADAAGRGGMAAGLAHQAAWRVRDAGQWLDGHKPGQVAGEMQSFARRRPAVFLALAAGAGLVAGRLTRGLKNAASDNSVTPTAPEATPGLSSQPAQPSDLAGYPPVPPAVSDPTRSPSGAASGLPATGTVPGPPAAPASGEPDLRVTDDQAGRQGRS
jgi:hypothetical protein